MQLHIRIVDPFGVVICDTLAPVAEGYAPQLDPAGRARVLGGVVPGSYVPALERQMPCEVLVSVAP